MDSGTSLDRLTTSSHDLSLVDSSLSFRLVVPLEKLSEGATLSFSIVEVDVLVGLAATTSWNQYCQYTEYEE